MLFYRVHRNCDIRTGMYRAANTPNDYLCEYDRHPMPYSDGLLAPKWSRASDTRRQHLYYFGFNTLEQFASWVYNPRWWKMLSDEGCVMSVFDIPADLVLVGYTQACARITNYTPLRTVEVPDWKTLSGVQSNGN